MAMKQTFFTITILSGLLLSPINSKESKVYNNTKYGIQFKYPQNWHKTWEGDWDSSGQPMKIHVIDISKYRSAPPREYAGIRIIISTQKSDISADVAKAAKDLSEHSQKSIESKELKISGIQAWRVLNTVIFQYGNYKFEITSSVSEQYFDAFLKSIVLQ
jgi:hypothetical protein